MRALERHPRIAARARRIPKVALQSWLPPRRRGKQSVSFVVVKPSCSVANSRSSFLAVPNGDEVENGPGACRRLLLRPHHQRYPLTDSTSTRDHLQAFARPVSHRMRVCATDGSCFLQSSSRSIVVGPIGLFLSIGGAASSRSTSGIVSPLNYCSRTTASETLLQATRCHRIVFKPWSLRGKHRRVAWYMSC